MYDIHKEIKLEKLRENQNRQNYLKLLAVSSLCIDFITYLTAETIELSFSDLKKHFAVLVAYLIKLSVFLIIGLIITISMFLNKTKILIFSTLIYFLSGLALFCYLIIEEIKTNSGGMQPIDDGKPEIYYKVFIYIIITLNILSGIFRILGVLFMLNEELTDYMKDNLLIDDKIPSRSPTFLTNKISVTGKNKEGSTAESDFKYRDLLRKNYSTFVEFREQRRKFGYDSIIGKSNQNEFESKPGSYDKKTTDRNTLVSRNQYNQIHVHIHNYNIYSRGSYKNSPTPRDSGFRESTDRENIGNMYETPRGSIS